MRKVIFLLAVVFFLSLASATYNPAWDFSDNGNISFTTGNVGIGTNSFDQVFQVEGDMNVTESIYANSSSLYLGTGKISFDSGGGQFVFYNESGSGELMFLNNGYGSIPLGSVLAFNLTSCPDGWILADGVPDGVPDLRGIFIRGAGVNSVLNMENGSAYGANFGEYSNDSFQDYGFRTRMIADSSPGSSTGGNYYPINADTSNSGWGDYSVAELISDSYGVPRNNSETTPAYLGLIYCVKVGDDTENVSDFFNESFDSVYLSSLSDGLGVGTTSPGESLEVAGDINSTGGDVCISGGNCLSLGILSGTISMFASACPSGWKTCNGTSGTPNLSDKFIRSMETPGIIGGSDDAVMVSHSHTFSGDALATHSHNSVDFDSHDHIYSLGNHRHSTVTTGNYFDETKIARGSNAATGQSASTSGTTWSSGDFYTGYYDPGPITSNSGVSAGTPSGTISTVGSSGTGANMPEYYSLVFCMKE